MIIIINDEWDKLHYERENPVEYLWNVWDLVKIRCDESVGFCDNANNPKKNGHIDKFIIIFLDRTIFGVAGEANRINTNTSIFERVARSLFTQNEKKKKMRHTHGVSVLEKETETRS